MRRSLCLVIIMFSGCSKFTSFTRPLTYDPAFFQSGGGDLNPPTDKISSNCAGDQNFDACVVYKNPTVQKQSPATVGDVNSLLKFGVKLRGLLPTGSLENQHVQILTLNTPRFTLNNPSERKDQLAADRSYLEQVSAYYWINRAFEYLSARVGEDRVALKGLKVYVDDVFTGFVSANQSIALSKGADEIPKALQADVILQLLGQSLAYNLSGGRSFDLHSSAQHKFCQLNPKGCCASELGCANALNSAFGDYLAAMMFPSSPRLGETVANSVQGQNFCGLPRDLAQLSSQTRSNVYAACDAGTHGWVALEGAWYASLWWKARAQAEAQDVGGGQDIDILFFDHAKQWTAAETFSDAKQQALALSAAYKSGKYTSILQAIFTAAAL